MHKINKKILSIPPFISTSWKQVTSLHVDGTLFIVKLHDGKNIEIPNLEPEVLKLAFDSHASYLEGCNEIIQQNPRLTNPLATGVSIGEIDSPFRFGISSMDTLGNVMQHNADQADTPDLPKEILEKIAAITNILSPEETTLIPKPEPHCNCIHCQIARTMQCVTHSEEEETVEEENVSDTELQFCQWDIEQEEKNLFNVINRLDREEKYHVFLGKPVGCTCGKEGCEHILAVLRN